MQRLHFLLSCPFAPPPLNFCLHVCGGYVCWKGGWGGGDVHTFTCVVLRQTRGAGNMCVNIPLHSSCMPFVSCLSNPALITYPVESRNWLAPTVEHVWRDEGGHLLSLCFCLGQERTAEILHLVPVTDIIFQIYLQLLFKEISTYYAFESTEFCHPPCPLKPPFGH